MAAVINFFRSRHLPRLDYVDIVMYFQENPHCEIVNTEEEMQIACYDPSYDLTYYYYITKRSRVSNIAEISAEYLNLRFLVEIPPVLPEQVSRSILMAVDELCKKFDLVCYVEGAEDAEEFDMMKMMNYIERVRSDYLADHEEAEVYTLPRETISHMCNYNQVIPFLADKIKEEVKISNYKLCAIHGNISAKLILEWEVGTPMVFPPHIDYIRVIDVNDYFYVEASAFYKIALRHMYEMKNLIPGASLLILVRKGLKRVTGKLGALRRKAIRDIHFVNIAITDIIEL